MQTPEIAGDQLAALSGPALPGEQLEAFLERANVAELLQQLHGILYRQQRKSEWFVKHTHKLAKAGTPLNICTAGMVGGWTRTRMVRAKKIVRRIQQKLGTQPG